MVQSRVFQVGRVNHTQCSALHLLWEDFVWSRKSVVCTYFCVLAEALATPYVSTNYSPTLCTKTWDCLKKLERGTAVFTYPTGE